MGASKEQVKASQDATKKANDAAKAKQDAQISASSGARAGPGQSNRGFNFQSTDREGNVEGASKGVPYSYNVRTGPSSNPVQNSPSNQMQINRQGRSVTLNLSDNVSVSEQSQDNYIKQKTTKTLLQKQQSGLYPGLSDYEGIPNNVPTLRSSGISSQPPTQVSSSISEGSPKTKKIILKPTPNPIPYIPLLTPSFKLIKSSSIGPPLPPLLRPKYLSKGQARYKLGPQSANNKIQIENKYAENKKIMKSHFGIVTTTEKSILQKPSNIPKFSTIGPYGAAFVSGNKAIIQNPTVQTIIKLSNISLKGEAAKIGKSKTQKEVSLSDATIIPGSIQYATSENKKPLVLYPYNRELDPLRNRSDLIETVQRPVLNLGKYFVGAVEGTKRIIQTGDPLAGQKYFEKDLGPKLKETASSRLFSNPSELLDPNKLPENLISATTEISMYAFMGGRLGKQKDTSIFKNFKSEIVKPGKGGSGPTGPSGGNVGGEYMTIKVKSPFSKSIRGSIRDFGNKFVKTTSKSKSIEPSKFPVLTKPSDIAPMYNIKKPDYRQWVVEGISKQNKFQGFDSIKIAKNMNTGEKIALAGRTKNKFLNVKEIKELKINPPEEFVKGKDGNVDVKTFFKSHFRFDRLQKSGFEEIKMTDQRTGISKTRTSINMNMGLPSKSWFVPRGKPTTSLNKAFETQKDEQVKTFKKFLEVERIKTNEEIFSRTGSGRNNQPGLLQKQASELKQEKPLKVELVNLQKQSFNVKSIALGLGKVYQPKQKPIKSKQGQNFSVPQMPKLGQGQNFFVPQMPKQKEGQAFFVPELSKQPTNQKQPQSFFIPEPTKSKQPTKQDQPQTFFIPEPTKQTQPWPFPTPSPQEPRPINPIPRGGFTPYFPSAFFGSGGYSDSASLKKSFAAYGISSDINIKTLPTYSRYSSGTGIFKAQANEDKRIQNLFYGKPKRKSKQKKKNRKKR